MRWIKPLIVGAVLSLLAVAPSAAFQFLGSGGVVGTGAQGGEQNVHAGKRGNGMQDGGNGSHHVSVAIDDNLTNPNAGNAANLFDILDPEWIALPVVASHYPEQAFLQKANGKVIMRCEILDTGFVNNCDVTSETPANLGFGKAALSMQGLYQMKQFSHSNDSVGGMTVSIPIDFELPAP